MLSELRIRNFALIDQLAVRLGPGLNVLTGETGAGKSIIVGALSLLLGERASADVVRAGTERASVEGVFEIGGREDVRRWLDEHGHEPDEDVVVLKREVAAEGRNRAWINGSPTTATLLGELGGTLVNLHGQHEHQTLLRRDEQRAILDAYAASEALVGRVGAAYRAHREVRQKIDELEHRRREAAQRADFLRFQAEEIETADLRPGEDEALEAEGRRLSHSEELMGLAGGLASALTTDEEALVSRLGGLRRAIEQLVRIDHEQAEVSELFDNAYYTLEELGNRMADYAGSVEHDPGRLEEIRRRQDLIYRLKTKYGASIEDVLETGRAARAELDLIDNAEWELASLQKQESAASDALVALATELTALRSRAMRALSKEVDAVLPELGMTGGRFEAVALPLPAPGPAGAEEVEFRVSLNKGFEPRPLAQVASGGELARVMLALKTILARLDSVPTLVFDEVDTGVGGRVALQVGDKMREVAGTHQVFAITHLPQIASRAHVHLLVRKAEKRGVTTTEVEMLDQETRVREVARMLGGDPESDVSLQHARELLDRAGALAGEGA
ncbi:MAG TPA: DNA repair protein RecN [Longimicrobiaceae bacterium]|nr:DNA repair protein RecN [Longimicrobiaceae bacterium]